MLRTGKEMAMNEELHEIADLVRRTFERIALAEGYSNDLQGLCGRAAVQVCLEAEQRGIPLRLVAAEGHAFSMTEDGEIVDVTATQFNYHDGIPSDGYGPIEIGRDHHDGLPWWYEEEESWADVREWLAEGTHNDLYYARSCWQKDRQKVILERARRNPAQMVFPSTKEEIHGS